MSALRSGAAGADNSDVLGRAWDVLGRAWVQTAREHSNAIRY